MKKQSFRVINTSVFGNFFKSAALVLLLTGGYVATQAAPASYANHENGAGLGKTVVNHLATEDQTLLFEVKVQNASGERFLIIVKDDNNNTLYRGYFNNKDFSKKFRLPKSESNKLIFTVKGGSENQTETFAINSNTRVIEEVVVTKVD